MLQKLLISKRNCNKIAVIEDGIEISYRMLFKKAASLARHLPKKAANVAIMLANGANFICALWGVIMSGNTAFPLNVLLTKNEVAPLIKQTAVSTIITSAMYEQLFNEIAKSENIEVRIINIDKLAADDASETQSIISIAEDKPMFLFNTSGTTEKCKVVQLSEKNVASSVFGYIDKMRFFDYAKADSIRFALFAPFCSAYGVMILSVCIMLSFPIIILNEIFTLDLLYRAAEKYKITNYEGSPLAILLMEQMIGREIPYDIKTLKYFGFGGSKISGRTIKNVKNAYNGMEFYQGYGMTEASPLIAKHPREKLVKVNSVGSVVKGMQAAVEKNGKIVFAPFTVGEIIVKGQNIMLGYYNNKEATKQAIKNGYLYTGDIGYLDEESFIYICGRKKNIIIVRGFNVYPEEIEECIQNSLLVKDCYVYASKDSFKEEVICADIVPLHSKVKKKDILNYLNVHLASYKQPQKIIFKKAIIKNAAGKTKRQKRA